MIGERRAKDRRWFAFGRDIRLWAPLATACLVAMLGGIAPRAHAATPVQVPHEPPSAAPAESPAEAYARLVRSLRELDAAHAGASPRSDIRRSGSYSAGSVAYLAQATEIVREISRLTPQLPRRELDHSQGFSLLLPHLGETRAVARAMSEVAASAMRSGDRALLSTMLDAQRDAVADSASDDILISSLVSMSIARGTSGALREALAEGLVDAATAQVALDATESLASAETYRLADAVALEGTMFLGEMGKLQAMSPEARAAQMAQMTGGEGEALDDATIAEALDKAPGFHAATRAALEDPDRSRGLAKLEELERRAEAGEFGAAIAALAPSLATVQRRLASTLDEIGALRADLGAIARGERSPESFLNAANLYVAAGKSLRALDGETQRDIEALCVAGDGLPSDFRTRTLDALRRTHEGISRRILRAARCTRCDFAEGAGAELDRDATFLIDGVDGVAGAVRLMLAEPLVETKVELKPETKVELMYETKVESTHKTKVEPTHQTKVEPKQTTQVETPSATTAEAQDAATTETEVERNSETPVVLHDDTNASPADRAVAALVALRRYADGRAYGRSLVAQQIARDLADALERYETRGFLDEPRARERLAAEFARIDRNDPFGFVRALPRERERVAALHAWPVGPSPVAGEPAEPVRIAAFSQESVAMLAPRSVAFVLGMCTPLSAIDPASPDATIEPAKDLSLESPLVAIPAATDGPFSDLRAWFDLAALREANLQRAPLRERLAKELAADAVQSAVVFRNLIVTQPVDIDRRIAESQDDLARLERLAATVSE